jgi:hypothetical protein
MGVIALYFIDYVVEVSLLSKCLATRTVSSNSLTVTSSSLLLLFYSLSGGREIFPGYRLKGYKFFLVHSLPFLFPLKS